MAEAAIRPSHLSRWGIPLVALAITAVLYGRSLSLPFYSDDLVQLGWLRGLAPGRVWQEASPYGYYRPLAFMLWLALPRTPLALRLPNLILHALAATLTGLLAASFDNGKRGQAAGLIAAAALAGYPFAYQAIPWVSAVFYPLSLCLLLGAALLYHRMLDRPTLPVGAACLALCFSAPLVHENGMLTGALLLSLYLIAYWENSDGPQRPARAALWLGLVTLAWNFVYFLIWRGLRGEVATLDLSLPTLLGNAPILGMGIAYPLIPLLGWSGLGPTTVAGIGLVAGLAILAALCRSAPAPAALGLLWAGLLAGPVLVTMRPAWLADAPRFLYPIGVGSALAWGWALSGAADRLRRNLPAPLLSGSLALILIGPGALWAWRGVGWHLRGGAALQGAHAIAATYPAAPLVMVNLPERLAPAASLYPYFDGGAILLPPQVPQGEVAGPDRSDRAIPAGGLLPPLTYSLALYDPAPGGVSIGDLLEDGHVAMVIRYDPAIARRPGDQATAHYAGRIVQGREADRYLATFAGQIRLLSAERTVSGVRLRWQRLSEADGAVPAGLAVFVHLVDEGGALQAQADGAPVAGLYPFDQWVPGSIVEDSRLLGSGLTGSLYVGIYDPLTGTRLPALDQAGHLLEDSRVKVD